ncbi:MAG: hypothetical protein WC225_04100 [Acholeplasmataceae bacterium]|nr:hypothetical protein [Acholeplasmataceae bacterium]
MPLRHKIVIHTVGFIVVALGLSLIICSQLGAAPLDAMNYFLHILISKSIPQITLGTVVIFTGIAATLFAFALNREKDMFISLIFIFVVGLFIDGWMFLLNLLPTTFLEHLATRISFAAIGLIISSMGVALTILTGLPASPYERIMLIIYAKTNNMVLSKLIIELTFLTAAIILGLITTRLFEQVYLFTIIMTFTLGALISYFTKIFKKTIVKGVLNNETQPND